MVTKNKSGVYEKVTYKQVGKRVDALRVEPFALGVAKDNAGGIIAANRLEGVVCAFAIDVPGTRFIPQHEKGKLH